jgi:transposase
LERALNQQTLRVYALAPQCVRIDTTTASGYWEVSEDGLFQFGHSKDHRPDQPQVKVVLSTLDPLGMPLATQVVSGEKADDPLYIPAIDQVRDGVEQRGLLYVGDSKLMAGSTRAYLQAGGDFYLGPFSSTQIPPDVLDAYLQPVWDGDQALQIVERVNAEGKKQAIAEGFTRREAVTVEREGSPLCWDEQRLVVRSYRHAQAAEKGLRRRLATAQTEIEALNQRGKGKKRFKEVAPLQQAAEAVVQHHRVEGLLRLRYHEQGEDRWVRRYGARPGHWRRTLDVHVQVEADEAAIQPVLRRLGWRVYGTNQSEKQGSVEQAVLAYREEYQVERGFGRLKGKPLSLTPMYLHDDQRATGLIRLLSLGLRVLTVLEGVVRRKLADTGEKLRGLYAGNPTRATARPTTELMLRAFNYISLSRVTLDDQTHVHLSPLSELQKKILHLLELPLEVYTRLTAVSFIPP